MKVGDKAEFVGNDSYPWGTLLITEASGESGSRWYEAQNLACPTKRGLFREKELKSLEKNSPAETTPPRERLLPTDAKERKMYPIATGVLNYFPSALLEIAKVSYLGNLQHNPGEKLHWARGKSTDQEDTAIRHFMERGGDDTDGVEHLAKACWRMLATLQLMLEAKGAPLARGAKEPGKE